MLSEPPLLCWYQAAKRNPIFFKEKTCDWEDLLIVVFWLAHCWHPREPWTAVCTMMAVIVVAMIEGTTSRAVVGGGTVFAWWIRWAGCWTYCLGPIQSLMLGFCGGFERFFGIFTPFLGERRWLWRRFFIHSFLFRAGGICSAVRGWEFEDMPDVVIVKTFQTPGLFLLDVVCMCLDTMTGRGWIAWWWSMDMDTCHGAWEDDCLSL